MALIARPLAVLTLAFSLAPLALANPRPAARAVDHASDARLPADAVSGSIDLRADAGDVPGRNFSSDAPVFAGPLREIPPDLPGTVERIAPAAFGGEARARDVEGKIEQVLQKPGDPASGAVEIGRIMDGMALASLPDEERAAAMTQAMSLVGGYLASHSLDKPWSPPADIAKAHPAVQDLARALKVKSDQLNAQHQGAMAKALQRFEGLIAVISHDFNNILQPVTGYLEILKRRWSAPAPANAAESVARLDIIQRNVDFLGTISKAFVSRGRLQAGGALQLEAKDAAMLMKWVARLEEGRAAAKRIELTMELPNSPVVVMANSDALAVVLKNLVENALKYTPEGGRVALGISLHTNEAVLYVRDTGIGISVPDRQRIFEGHRTEAGKQAADGHGIGLGNVLELVEAQGSRIHVDSEVGKGSTFRFALPLAGPPN